MNNKLINEWLTSVFTVDKIRKDLFEFKNNDNLKHYKDDLFYIFGSFEYKPETLKYLISNKEELTFFHYEF
jgi:hypothetical protein